MSAVAGGELPARLRVALAQAQRLHQSDRLAEAEAAYLEVLTAAPRSFLALHGLGLIALRRNRLDEGAARIQQALATEPRQLDAWLNLSRARLLMGEHDAACAAAERALALQPGHADALLARAAALAAGRPAAEAIGVLEQTAAAAPGSVEAWVRLGEAQRELHRFDEAVASFQQALRLDATQPAALEGYAQALMQQHRYEDAALVLERLWTPPPDHPLAGGMLLHAKMMMCDWLRVDELRRRVADDIDAGRLVAEPFGVQGWCASPATLRRCAETLVARFHPEAAPAQRPAARPGGGRIRIGYVSGEFRHQATSILLVELLERHDRSRFEVVAFDNGWDDGSALRRRIMAAFDELVPIRDLDDTAAAEAVRSRGIDLLVNLNGFFGEGRMGLFSRRPAPVQVNYLGFPGTLGAPYIDYLLADRWVIPPAQRAHYREAVVTLPHSYQPNDRRRAISDLPVTRRDAGLPEHGFVFCCFNNTYKLTPEVFAVWMRLLRQVPGSVLWFFGWIPEAVANLAREAQAAGIDPARVVPAPFLPLDRHLARLGLADLFVDTWPYNAHTTGSDALWAGVPVVTVTGDTFPSRVGASLLDAVGLSELITSNLADYEALALALARTPQRLAGLRERLRRARDSAPLFDAARLCGHVESAYRTMVERSRTGLAPQDFAVAEPG